VIVKKEMKSREIYSAELAFCAITKIIYSCLGHTEPFRSAQIFHSYFTIAVLPRPVLAATSEPPG
jgi:hypothetical protein